MQDGFKIEKTNDVEEQIILDIMEKITENIGGKFAVKANKLLSKIKNSDYNPIYAKLNIEDISDKLKEVQLLENAIKNRIKINCKYSFNKGKYTTTLQPLKIANYEGFWYLIAMGNNKLKKFYLKDVSNIELSDESFEIDEKVDKLLNDSISVWFQRNEPFEVKLLANAKIAKYFQRKSLPTQTITSINDDGSMEFIVKVTHEMEILPIIKYWIPNLEIISPKSLKDTLLNEIERYLKK